MLDIRPNSEGFAAPLSTMATNKRTLFEVHFHSHGNVQVGPRLLSEGEDEAAIVEPESPGGGGRSLGIFIAVVGGAIAIALARRRLTAEREEPDPREQKNLDRWIPTR